MTPDQPSELDLRHLLGVARRRGWIVVVLVVVVAGAAYGLAARQPDLYAATSKVQVRESTGSLVLEGGQLRTADAQREISTQLEFLQSAEVERAVDGALGDDAGRVQSMSASNVANTDIVTIRVVSQSPQVAQAAANAYAQQYVDLRQAQLTRVFDDRAVQLEDQMEDIRGQLTALEAALEGPGLSASERAARQAEQAGLSDQVARLAQQASSLRSEGVGRSSGVLVIEEAGLPSRPFSPTPLRNAAVAALIALVIGIVVVVLVEMLDDRLASPEQAEQLTGGVPVVGMIPVSAKGHRWLRRKLPHGARGLVPADSPAAEAFRTLQTSIRFSSLGKSKQTLAITSSVGAEGKSTVVANLAVALAHSGLRVVVVSADLRKPTISGFFGVPEADRGLTSVLVGDARLVDSIVSVDVGQGRSLYVLPAGPLPHNPAELLGSRAFGAVLTELEEAGADYILIDCPPVLPVSDPLAVAQHVDGVLVLAVLGSTPGSGLADAIGRLRTIDAPIVGMVLNGIPLHGYGSRYGYAYQYGYGTPPPAPTGGTGPASPNGSNGSNGASGRGRARGATGTDPQAADPTGR